MVMVALSRSTPTSKSSQSVVSFEGQGERRELNQDESEEEERHTQLVSLKCFFIPPLSRKKSISSTLFPVFGPVLSTPSK